MHPSQAKMTLGDFADLPVAVRMSSRDFAVLPIAGFLRVVPYGADFWETESLGFFVTIPINAKIVATYN